MSQLTLVRSAAREERSERLLILVGHPNVGKSLLFTRLTKRYATVSNYPGTTVEITRAAAILDGRRWRIVDTPGIGSLTPHSEDERVTRDLLLESGDEAVLQVGDITNLQRTLSLSLQLAELEIPFVLSLNMSDDEDAQRVDTDALSRALDIPVLTISALRAWNLEKLERAIQWPRRSPYRIEYAKPIEDAINALMTLTACAHPRGIVVAFLAGDDSVKHLLSARGGETVLDKVRRDCASQMKEPLAAVIAAARVAVSDTILDTISPSTARISSGSFRDRLGSLTMHRFWGVPILAGVLYLAWLFVGKFGAGTLVDFFEEQIFGAYVNPSAIRFANTFLPDTSLGRFLLNLLVGEYGVITMAITYAVAIVLPVVMTFFTFFGIIEDSGYLPRLAVMLNRIFRRIGLNGKAVLPMVLGLGCDTMATITTRTLDSTKQRVIVTILLALGVPCSAQLGVIAAMLSPLGAPAIAAWLGVTVATIAIVGWIASKVVSGDRGDFIMDIPPLRMPRFENLLIKVAARTEWYLKEAVPLFIIGTLLLTLLDAAHLVEGLQRAAAPVVVGALGLPAEAANAFVVGFLRRDYGAAGLYAMQQHGRLTPNQTVVALTVITLFIPCIANYFVIVRERGARMGVLAALFIGAYSITIGALMNYLLQLTGASF